MNVLVTGGAGYIGSICAEELLNAGHQVTVYDNLSEGHRSAVDSRAKFILGKPEQDGDILNAVKSAKPDAIMHFGLFVNHRSLSLCYGFFNFVILCFSCIVHNLSSRY